MIAQSALTRPVCGTAKAETMPTDARTFIHGCTGCAAVLRPKPGDCCVVCSYGDSYGDVPCPPVQADGEAACCGGPPGPPTTSEIA